MYLPALLNIIFRSSQVNSDGEVKYDQNGMINIDELNKVIGELKGIDIEDTTFSVESFNEYNSIISEKKDKNKN